MTRSPLDLVIHWLEQAIIVGLAILFVGLLTVFVLPHLSGPTETLGAAAVAHRPASTRGAAAGGYAAPGRPPAGGPEG